MTRSFKPLTAIYLTEGRKLTACGSSFLSKSGTLQFFDFLAVPTDNGAEHEDLFA